MTPMKTTVELEGGRFATCAVLELSAVPFYELIAASVAEAAARVDTLFARIVNDVHRRAEGGDFSVELLFVTTPTENQTYQAQTRIFFVMRALGTDLDVLRERVAEVARSAELALKESGYAVASLQSAGALEELSDLLAEVHAETVWSVARQERTVGGQVGMGLYYNDVITPSSGDNASILTNALSQYPNVAVSLQLIPTAYTEAEQSAVAAARSYVDGLRSQIMMTPGGVVPAPLTDAAVAYVDFINNQRQHAYYANLLTFGPKSAAQALAGKLVDLMLDDEQVGSTALVVSEVTGAGICLADDFAVSPWINSDVLVHECRESAYWDSPMAPTNLIRLKHLLPAAVVRAAFKAPFDDGETIGIASKRSLATKEKLDDTVLAPDSFRIGTLLDVDHGSRGSAQAGVPLQDFSRHALIVGASGYGKTNFALGMLLRLWREFGIPFLVIEPTKTEYRVLIEEIPDIAVFTPGRNEVVPFIINPFAPPPNVTVESYVPSLMTAFSAAFEMPDPLPGIFRAVMNDCYSLHGWKSTSTVDDPHARPFGLYEFIRMFKDKVRRLDYQGETKSNIESAGVVRLTSLLEQNSNIYDTVHTIPWQDLMARPAIIELNAIGDKEQKSLLMALILVALCAYTKSNAALDGRLKNVLLIDEAHVLLGGGARGGETARSTTVEALEDMIAEVRAYGTGIVIADQSPTNVGRNVIANTDVKIMFRLMERESREMVSRATSMDPTDEALLGQLGTGECLLHYGRVGAPLHVMVDDVRDTTVLPETVADEQLRARVDFWRTRSLLLRPHTECRLSRCCTDGCDPSTRVDAEFVASNIVARYVDHMSDWSTVQELLYLRLPATVEAAMTQLPGVSPSQRLRDCTTIRVLRKILLAKNISVSDAAVLRTLRDERVMPIRTVTRSAAGEGQTDGD